MESKPITEFTKEELERILIEQKASMYDLSIAQNNAQQTIAIVQAELQKRAEGIKKSDSNINS